MRRDEVLAILAEHQDEIRARGVASLSIFGSVARDEAGPESDIDIFIEIGRRPFTLFDLVNLKEFLEGILGSHVDLVIKSSIKDRIRENVLNEAIRAA
jgi:uncharacterized protein